MTIGCKTTTPATNDQGISGKVLWLEGNFMPGPNQSKSGEPVERRLFFYPLIKHADLSKQGNFYKKPAIDPVATVKSDADGNFSIALPTGKYSVFSEETEGLFANLQDGEGHIYPVEVKKGAFTDITFKIDYMAVY